MFKSRGPKYALITRVTDAGLLKLIDDLNRLYEKHRFIGENIEIRIRKCKEFGPYQVNILNKDFQEMLSRKSEDEFIQSYREEM